MGEKDHSDKQLAGDGGMGYAIRFMLTISDVSKAYGPQILFDEVSLQINRTDRVGLIG